MSSVKKILLICPAFFGYEQEIKKEIELSGWDVTFYDTRPANNFMTKALLRLGAHWAIRKKIVSYHDDIVKNIKENFYHKALFINPEGFATDFFRQIKEINPNMELLLYLWDSIDNKPLTKPIIPFFNKCFTFDRFDRDRYPEFSFLPLFFSRNYEKVDNNKEKKFDLTFIGTVHSQRMEIVSQIDKIAKNSGMKFYTYLFMQSKIIFWYRMLTDMHFARYGNFTFRFVPLAAREVKDIFSVSRAVIDIEHNKQKGLTMRTFEVLGAGIKLITTNKDIVNYDIYHPNNIAVIDRENVKLDPKFISLPFHEYSDEIIGNYSLRNWLNQIIVDDK